MLKGEESNRLRAALYNLPMSARRTSSLSITRRRWTALLGIAPFAVQLGQAQSTSKIPPQGAPIPPAPAAAPGERLQKAYADVHSVSVKLSQIEVPMSVEPAFIFKP